MRIPERLNTTVLCLATWLLVVLYLASEQLADPDLWGRLSIAALYFQNGKFPYRDVFSYTAPHAKWIDHEWLTGFIFYGLFTRFGEAGFLAFKYLLILATFACLFWLHRRVYKASPLYAFLGLLSLMTLYSFGYQATLRAQAFSFFFFVVFVALLESVRLGKFRTRALGWLLPLLVIWANCHGGFIVGILLLALYGIGEAITQRSRKPLLEYGGVAALGCLLIAFLNPYGPEYWKFLFHAWSLNREHISEWSAVELQNTRFWPVQLLIATLMVSLLARGWVLSRQQESPRPLITPALILLFLLAMALRGIRFQTFLAYGAIAYSPVLFSPDFLRHLPQGLVQFWERNHRTFHTVIPRLLLLGSIIGLCFMQSQRLLFQIPMGDELTQGNTWGHYPIGAVRYLRQSPYAGNLLIRFGHGEFAYWCLYPRFKISMDGRYEEVYTQAQFMENYQSLHHEQTLHGDRAYRLINQSAADFVLLDIKLPVTPLLLHSDAWQLIYQDPYFLIFARKSSLRRLPAFNKRQDVTAERLTMQDFITPADLKRFKF